MDNFAVNTNQRFDVSSDVAGTLRRTRGYAPEAVYDEASQSYTLTIAAAEAGTRQMLHALYPKSGRTWYHFGQLDIDTRATATHNVCLIPMGGAFDRNAIAQTLNDIYGRIGIHWEVIETEGFAPDKELTQGLFDKESSKLTSYNDKMSALNKALRGWLDDRYDQNTAYVLLFDDATGDAGKESAGFMPLGCQFAYINCAKADDVARTVAHELGHGCFLLRHPFDDAYGSSDMRERERTDFLMGYNDGSHLPKWQWDMVYAPAVFKPLVKEEEDGEMLSLILLPFIGSRNLTPIIEENIEPVQEYFDIISQYVENTIDNIQEQLHQKTLEAIELIINEAVIILIKGTSEFVKVKSDIDINDCLLQLWKDEGYDVKQRILQNPDIANEIWKKDQTSKKLLK